MRIVSPSFEISTLYGPLTPETGVKMLQFIERMARISHRSETGQTEDSWKRFIEAVVVGHGDWSVSEHQSLTVTFRVDRGTSHQMVRHRQFSYTQESQRFVNYAKKADDLEVILPTYAPVTGYWHWAQAVQTAETEYFELLKAGWRPQEARSVLPNAIATTVGMTGNLRAWRYFLLSRTTKETQSNFTSVTIPLLAEFQKNIPFLYSDIEPLQKQSISMAKAH